MDKELILKTIEREKWYPVIKPTNFEYNTSLQFNAFLDSLKDLDKEEIITTLRVYKHAMINIALALDETL